MSVISKLKILEKIFDQKLKIEPFVYDHVNSSSIELTLSDKLLIPKNNKKIEQQLTNYELKPSEFILTKIEEELTLPNCVAGDIKNKLVQTGIRVESTSHLDPGYQGQLPLAIHNLGNRAVELNSGMKICQLVLHKVEPKVVNSEQVESEQHLEEGIKLKGYLDQFQDIEKNLNDEVFKSFLSDKIDKQKDSWIKKLNGEEKEKLGLID